MVRSNFYPRYVLSSTVAHHTGPHVALRYDRVFVITASVITKFYCSYEWIRRKRGICHWSDFEYDHLRSRFDAIKRKNYTLNLVFRRKLSSLNRRNPALLHLKWMTTAHLLQKQVHCNIFAAHLLMYLRTNNANSSRKHLQVTLCRRRSNIVIQLEPHRTGMREAFDLYSRVSLIHILW